LARKISSNDNVAAVVPIVAPLLSFPPEDTSHTYLVTAKSRGDRSIALTGTNRGSFVGAIVAWIGDRWQTISFESRHEMMTAYLLLSHPKLTDLREQVRSPGYVDSDGVHHDHVFDFVATIDGKDHAIACKLQSSTDRLNFRATLGLLASQMGEFADTVDLVVEGAFSRTRAFNAELFHFLRFEHDEEADQVVSTLVSSLEGVTTVAAIVAASGLKGRGWRSLVRMCAHHRVAVVRGRIDDYTTLIARDIAA
jgi:hypothetical protein